MAFVIEELTEQDEEFIAGFQFKAPLGGGMADISSKWAADRARGYYLVSLGGFGWRSYDTTEYPPSYYRLILENKVMEIAARFYHEGTSKTGVIMHWKLESIYVDETINIPEKKLLEIVHEAFVSYAKRFYSGHVIKVCMEYVANPIYTPRLTREENK